MPVLAGRLVYILLDSESVPAHASREIWFHSVSGSFVFSVLSNIGTKLLVKPKAPTNIPACIFPGLKKTFATDCLQVGL